MFDEHRQELHVSIPEGSICIEADPTRLEQILSNLLLNAAKYTPKVVEIWLEVERDAGKVVIRVRDTGIGIEPELLPKVFDLFLQGERRIGLSHEGGDRAEPGEEPRGVARRDHHGPQPGAGHGK